MSKLLFIVIVGASLTLGGCANVKGARTQVDKSREAYRTCLLDNPRKPTNCDSLKHVYELDQESLEKVKAGSLSGIGDALIKSSQSGHEWQPQSETPFSHTWMMNQGGRSYMCNDIGGMVNCN